MSETILYVFQQRGVFTLNRSDRLEGILMPEYLILPMLSRLVRPFAAEPIVDLRDTLFMSCGL